jgi:voltage-gated potassium channel
MSRSGGTILAPADNTSIGSVRQPSFLRRRVLSLLLGLAQLGRTIARTARNPEFRALLIVYGVLLAIGTGFYARVEGWSVLDAMYFCVLTLATVGFGDLTPRTPLGRAFTIVYVLIGTGVFVGVAAEFAITILRGRAALAVNEGARRADDALEGRHDE